MSPFFDRLELLIPPPVLLVLLGAMAWGIAVTSPSGLVLPAAPYLAVLVGIAGLALNLLPKIAFRRLGTTVNPLRPHASTAVVTSGLYRFSRNPMYLGHVLILSAWVIALRSPESALLPLFQLAYLTRFQVVPEERVLSARLPIEYAAYVKTTRRWL